MAFKDVLKRVELDHLRALVEVDIPSTFAPPDVSNRMHAKYAPQFRVLKFGFSIFPGSGLGDILSAFLGFPSDSESTNYKALRDSPTRSPQDRLCGFVWIPIQMITALIVGIFHIFMRPNAEATPLNAERASQLQTTGNISVAPKETLSTVGKKFLQNFFVQPFRSFVHSFFQLIRGVLAWPLRLVSLVMWVVYKVQGYEPCPQQNDQNTNAAHSTPDTVLSRNSGLEVRGMPSSTLAKPMRDQRDQEVTLPHDPSHQQNQQITTITHSPTHSLPSHFGLVPRDRRSSVFPEAGNHMTTPREGVVHQVETARVELYGNRGGVVGSLRSLFNMPPESLGYHSYTLRAARTITEEFTVSGTGSGPETRGGPASTLPGAARGRHIGNAEGSVLHGSSHFALPNNDRPLIEF